MSSADAESAKDTHDWIELSVAAFESVLAMEEVFGPIGMIENSKSNSETLHIVVPITEGMCLARESGALQLDTEVNKAVELILSHIAVDPSEYGEAASVVNAKVRDFVQAMWEQMQKLSSKWKRNAPI